MTTTIINTNTANETGFYKWFGADNDCEYRGFVRGYACAFCVEVRMPDGTLDYSSVTFVRDEEETEIRMPDPCGEDYTEIGLMASLCSRNGATPTGRIVFRGYYSPEWDEEEWEEYYSPASAEVASLFERYVK